MCGSGEVLSVESNGTPTPWFLGPTVTPYTWSEEMLDTAEELTDPACAVSMTVPVVPALPAS